MNWLVVCVITFSKNAFSNIILKSISEVNVQTIMGRKFFIKRDDLRTLEGLKNCNGNKYRKLKSLVNENPFPSIIASYGGIQSNSMVAIAAICRYKSSLFNYYTLKVPSFLIKNPLGNYKYAIESGMQVSYSLQIILHLFKRTKVW
jgi:1-aminocyclopropane-1-carboxylate deaminase/D-cysteine desulfhydrase-like pyridoxal-dependent ACC family enzyme